MSNRRYRIAFLGFVFLIFFWFIDQRTSLVDASIEPDPRASFSFKFPVNKSLLLFIHHEDTFLRVTKERTVNDNDDSDEYYFSLLSTQLMLAVQDWLI